MSYFIHNIRFEQLETVLRLYKSQSREEGEVLSFFTNKENQQAHRLPKLHPSRCYQTTSLD